MSSHDRWWIVWCALGAVALAKADVWWGELIAGGFWLLMLIVTTVMEGRTPDRLEKMPAAQPVPMLQPGPLATMVADAMAAARSAGCTEDKAQQIAQEMIVTSLKASGAWKP